jgi:acylphosphatase
MSTIRRHIVVSGRVQGVGFRWSCKDQADRLGIAGWVRNQPNGTVEVVAEGEDRSVNQMVGWCRRGPRHALVTDVEVSTEQPLGEPEFNIS